MIDPDNMHSPSRLTAIRTVADAVTVVRLEGEIDHHTAPRLRQALSADRADGPARMVIDLDGVAFMDSSGLNALIDLHQAVQDASGWVRLAGIQQPVQRLLELSGLQAFFDCYPTLRRALAA
ncbi:STAS domain-containing protein [Streptomyces minutiscleroticus]|uniref:Anti-sigma factor antagonist n=1 Tax=Streptomyces minutiscleroticus TaxID=68238 RepID=A0A918NX16_9ACTN|nr:STAS domain-containing protein [Streptomyces minutiscleroticus]GGY00652.1 anti-sigma factor antagonist [Streptomyces minutiscleroticus]